MRAADLATIVVVLVLAGGAAGAFFHWKAETARAEERAYEAAIDQAVDGKIRAAQLSFLAPMLTDRGGANVETLRTLYADRAHSDRLNLGFGTLHGDLRTSYARVAENFGREAERGRVAAELDERFGAGAHALMQERYAAFLADLPRRTAEENARQEREAREWMNALDNYVRRTGHYPQGGFRVENGRVVEID